MQFKHPEILYALLLLIIPVLVHLFQLQRFKKVPFTNVQFLKNIEQQTRKSARLKKLLLLLFRLLAFSCIILAFSQPFFSTVKTTQNFNTIIYLDNSFSMQAKGANGELLKTISHKIIESNLNENTTVSLITNTKSFSDLDSKGLKKELINSNYSPNKMELNTVLLKAQNIINSKGNTLHTVVLISDFQNINSKSKLSFANLKARIKLLQVRPKSTSNIYIDSVYIHSKTATKIEIKIVVKSTKKSTQNIPISLFNESKLIGKSTIKFKNAIVSTVTFTIPNTTNFNGKVSLIDSNLRFDNDFFFSITTPKKINVLNIGKQANFLQRIYTKNEFNFASTSLQNLNYNHIQNQQLIILNEIDSFPEELNTHLYNFVKNVGSLVLIPSENSNINTYNTFFKLLNIGKITTKIKKEHLITTINYEHPILKDVFEKKVTNFQYPKTAVYFKTTLKNASSILKLDTNTSFIASTKNNNNSIYWVASPLNTKISNITQSPIIVPIFYNFAKNNLKIAPLYYTIASENKIEIKTSIGKDEVLKISSKTTEEFIPLQKISQNKVRIILQDNISKSGFYTLKNNNIPIKTIAFNYNRKESNLAYANIKEIVANNKNVTVATSITEIFTEINKQQKINWLFKWFLAFSILFLLIEMGILKYFKI